MKKIVSVLFACIVIVALIISSVANVCAISPIDSQKKSSLTLQYKHGENFYSGIEIKTYRIAEVFPDGTYALWGDFKDYSVNIYDISSKTEWDKICSTLSAFAVADNIAPTCSAITDEKGTVVFKDILPGMYLTLSVDLKTEKELVKFESFITAVPTPDDNGNHNYNVTAYPKCELLKPSEKEIEYKIVKHWKDSGYTSKRPKTIEIDVLKDGVVKSTQKLSKENNWSYSWVAIDDGSQWQAIEKNIPSSYSMTVIHKDNTIIITNTYDSLHTDPPKTGETTVLWPWVLAMCVSGVLIILLSIWRKRAEG